MFEQITELETLQLKLEKANSLFQCLIDRYFSKYEPDCHELVLQYDNYVNIIHVIWDMIAEQNKALQEIINSLYTTYRGIKKAVLVNE